MGYSKSKSRVTKVQPILDILLEHDTDFRLPTATPDELSYRLHEAIKIVERNPNSFTEYTKLVDKFTQRIGEQCIIFKRKRTFDIGIPERITQLRSHAAAAVEPTERIIRSITSAIQVVGAAITHKSDVFIFPDVEGDRQSIIDDVNRWASKNGYEITNLNPFTLSRSTDDNSIRNKQDKIAV